MIVDDSTPPAQWAFVETDYPTEGYVVDVGVGSFGATETLCPGLIEQLPDTTSG